ncbi:hypothetical protein HK405_007682, partial [Cladochytrium tenue]
MLQLFTNYHVWRCFLLRRQLIMYLRCMEAETAVAGELGNSSSDGSGGGPAVPPLAEAPATALACPSRSDFQRSGPSTGLRLAWPSSQLR